MREVGEDGFGPKNRDWNLRWSWGWDGGPLAAEVDYTGSGVVDDPFIVAPHLAYYIASPKLAAQILGTGVLKIETPSRTEGRMIATSSEGQLCDVWRYAGRECWIQAPGESEDAASHT